MEEKDLLRRFYFEKRKNLSEKERNEYSAQISQSFLESKWMNATVFHVFLPIEKKFEINTWTIIHGLWKKKKTVVSSIILNDTELEHYELLPTTNFTQGEWNTKKPIEYTIFDITLLEIILTPLLFCNHKGNRIGYGKGFYDQFFSKTTKVTKIGLNYFPSQRNENNLWNSKDQPLDYLISPFCIESFCDSIELK